MLRSHTRFLFHRYAGRPCRSVSLDLDSPHGPPPGGSLCCYWVSGSGSRRPGRHGGCAGGSGGSLHDASSRRDRWRLQARGRGGAGKDDSSGKRNRSDDPRQLFHLNEFEVTGSVCTGFEHGPPPLPPQLHLPQDWCRLPEGFDAAALCCALKELRRVGLRRRQ